MTNIVPSSSIAYREDGTLRPGWRLVDGEPHYSSAWLSVDELGQIVDLTTLANGGACPGCGLIMSVREQVEQGACNECNGGACEL